MSSGVLEPKGESKGELHHGDHIDINQSEVLVNADLMNDAVHGENRVHGMSMWAAVKNYPWACFWAFVMTFTIVSLRLYSLLWIQSLDLIMELVCVLG